MANGYINDGTAAATAGSKTVTFAGVSVSLFRAGWIFQQGGASGTIASLDADAGTATLVENWGGETSDDAAYTVLIIPDSRVLAETTVRWLEYLNGPILSIAEMMGDDAPGDGDMLVGDTGIWVKKAPADVLADLLTDNSTGTGDVVRADSPTLSGSLIGPDGVTWDSDGIHTPTIIGTMTVSRAVFSGNVVEGLVSITSSTSNIALHIARNSGAGDTGSLDIDFNSNNTFLRSLNSFNVISGDSGGMALAVGATSWGSISERGKKRDIEQIAGATSIIAAHETSLGRYIDDPDEREKRAFLFYEDAAEHWPAAASSDGENSLVMKEEYIPLIMAAIKELDARDAVFETRLAALEAA